VGENMIFHNIKSLFLQYLLLITHHKKLSKTNVLVGKWSAECRQNVGEKIVTAIKNGTASTVPLNFP
jgi:hypothetical protein